MCDTPTVFRAVAYVARTPKTCDECRRTIRPGELYENAFGVWDGRAGTYHTCAECFEVRAELYEDLSSPGAGLYPEEVACALAFGNLREELAEHVRQMAA